MDYIVEQPVYSVRVVTRLLDAIIAAIELLLALRVFLVLFGANPSSGFVAWLYATTDQLLVPFAGMFPAAALSGVYIIDFSALFGMLVYAFVGWLLIKTVSLITNGILRMY